MKKVLISLSIVPVFCALTIGCAEHSTSTKTETLKTPNGSTTVTTKQEVEKTGDHKDK